MIDRKLTLSPYYITDMELLMFIYLINKVTSSIRISFPAFNVLELSILPIVSRGYQSI